MLDILKIISDANISYSKTPVSQKEYSNLIEKSQNGRENNIPSHFLMTVDFSKDTEDPTGQCVTFVKNNDGTYYYDIMVGRDEFIYDFSFSSKTGLKGKFQAVIESIPYSVDDVKLLTSRFFYYNFVYLRVILDRAPDKNDSFQVTFKNLRSFHSYMKPHCENIYYEKMLIGSYFIYAGKLYHKSESEKIKKTSKDFETKRHSKKQTYDFEKFMSEKEVLHTNKYLTSTEARKYLSKNVEAVSYLHEQTFRVVYDNHLELITEKNNIIDNKILLGKYSADSNRLDINDCDVLTEIEIVNDEKKNIGIFFVVDSISLHEGSFFMTQSKIIGSDTIIKHIDIEAVYSVFFDEKPKSGFEYTIKSKRYVVNDELKKEFLENDFSFKKYSTAYKKK